MNTGDQQSHLSNTHDRLVLHHKWLSETQYKEVLDLCWSLPGPTTLQVIITIVTLKTRSLMVGVNSFVIYNILPWIFLTILGLLSATFVQSHVTNLPLTVQLFFMGFNAASAGIMVRNFISYLT
jgi:chromate transport protein ChrA